MPSSVKIYRVGDFIRKTESGKLDLDRSISIVRELAAKASYHKEHNIMLDLRETDLNVNLGDLIHVSLEFASYKEVFNNKIAVLIPNTEKRRQIAKRFKACMDIQGFEFRQFIDFESAIEWLSD
jgi:hypothetical protein